MVKHTQVIVDCYRQTEAAASPEKKKIRLDPFADLRDCASTSASAAPFQPVDSAQELANYKGLEVPAAASGPLQYWKQHASDYPILSLTARRILCISASSAQSERDFSSVGRTITDVRSRLSADKVEDIEMIRWGMRAGLSHD